jgi:hypothetical protein
MNPMAPEHQAKVQRCLDLLQRAQLIVNEAAQALCPVPGFADEWSELSEPHYVIKRHWYKINNKIAIILDDLRVSQHNQRSDK